MMVSNKFGRKSMNTGSRYNLSSSSFGTSSFGTSSFGTSSFGTSSLGTSSFGTSSFSNRSKGGSPRGNSHRGSRQNGRWRGTGRGRQLPNAYPSQPSRTLANVIRYQRKRGITPGGGRGQQHNTDNVYNAELRKQFPVSSGSQHREKENPGPKVAPHLKLMVEEGNNYPPIQRYGASTSSAPRFGMKMLQKFGWSPGKGLGKYEEGTVEPVIPDGLYAQEYQPKKEPMEVIEDMSAKHPVMALTELCTRHKWPAPKFEVVDYSGPDHKKNFLMKVIVNGQEYKPEEASTSKKIAKAEAAAMFLESLGMYDRKKAPQWN
ncbi:protein Son-like [Eriocheir sinensis]|uniref:protein Son-like n=1 Tax=Eriocheir sinensis TaxID=95602 RepID=UPI0021C6AC3F|nr:protein Son-like [Eriocheir sinensis]